MKNSVFANGLMVLIGILMLVAALQLFGWGKGTSNLEPEPFNVNSLPQLKVRDQVETLDGEELVEQIVMAPLFNLDRKPYERLEELEDPKGPEIDIEAEPLKAQITSIMMIGEEKFAMILDQVTKEKITLAQGMPLPGEQGLWVVDEIQSRQVTFVSDGKEPVSIELEVFDGALNKGQPNKNRNKNNRNRNTQVKQADAKQENKNSAEEIRRKIAERRAQMRANAANNGTKK